MERADVHWASVPFLALHHHDGHRFRQPGLFGLVRRLGDQRTLLYIGEAENLAAAYRPQAIWPEALGLGLNELNIALHVVERIDRLILRNHIVKHCEPLLNLLEASGVEERPLDNPPQPFSALGRAHDEAEWVNPSETFFASASPELRLRGVVLPLPRDADSGTAP